MANFDVTIIVPAHNRLRLLEQAIASADAAIRAAGAIGEIVAVDDASTDGTSEWLSRHPYNVRVISFNENRGRAEARNAGLGEARGEFVKFLDSDDRLETGSLSRELESGTRQGADLVVAGWGQVEIDAEGNEVESSRKGYPAPEMNPIPETLLLGRAVPTSAALYRCSRVAANRWDAGIGNFDDWHWFCQAAWSSSVISRVDGVAYWMRDHGERITSHSAPLRSAHSLVRVLEWMEQRLRGEDRLTPERSRRLAQYYYKELRVLCLYDRPKYEEVADKILSLDPAFVPRDEERQSYMRTAARLVGFRRATELHCLVKTTLVRFGVLERWV